MKLIESSVNALISIASIAGAVFITNFAGQRIGLGNPLLYRSDNLVGYRLAPDQKEKRRNNATVTVNSEGFRIDPSAEQGAPNSLVFVGDSVTFGGSYIDDKDLFASIVCKNFPALTCLNSGVNSWGTLNMGRFIKYFDLYSTSKVNRFILVVLPGDEGRNLRSFSDTPYWDSSPIFPSAISEILSYLTWKYFYKSLRSGTPTYPKVDSKIKSAQLKESWEDLFRYTKQSKSRVDLIITPPRRWFENPDSYSEEISYYDMIAVDFASHNNSKSCNIYHRLKPAYSPDWYVDSVHLSANGHSSWAKEILMCTQ